MGLGWTLTAFVERKYYPCPVIYEHFLKYRKLRKQGSSLVNLMSHSLSHPFADVLRLPIPEIVHSSYGDQKEGDVFVLENLLAAGFRGFKEVRTNQKAASGHVITVLISDWRATPGTRT